MINQTQLEKQAEQDSLNRSFLPGGIYEQVHHRKRPNLEKLNFQKNIFSDK